MQNLDYGNLRPRAMIALHAGKAICCNPFQTLFFILLDHVRILLAKPESGTQRHINALANSLSEFPIVRYCFPPAFFERKTRV